MSTVTTRHPDGSFTISRHTQTKAEALACLSALLGINAEAFKQMDMVARLPDAVLDAPEPPGDHPALRDVDDNADSLRAGHNDPADA